MAELVCYQSSGCSSVDRVLASEAKGRGFDPRQPRQVKNHKKSATIEDFPGGVPEWLKGADCKSVGLRLRWFESSLLHQ